MQVRLGQIHVNLNIDLLEVEDFVKDRKGEVVCKVIETSIRDHYLNEMREKLKNNDLVEAQKIESYVTALEDVCHLIRSEIPEALRESLS